ncbi:WD repeat-containing protein RUP2 [Acorus gramineus]|uniref:WD repeat-containing protein RUP2 n=1 Tax=Acorus gramineus TaxID=55184 RepID=A0AAV9AAC1_ACOGR|nr:WD repeat-containing protein RUP2 [Acorus gramineus]
MNGQAEKARHEWDFTLSKLITSTSRASNTSDTLGAVELDPSNRLLATGGIARKIRIYNLTNNDALSADHADICICVPAKLSSLCWRPEPGSRVGRVVCAGDYDGVVTEYDVERSTPLSERDEHGGRRVWSVDYSRAQHQHPLGASGSDDGTAHVWDARSSSEGLKIKRGSPVCCVEFDPAGSGLIALGCANQKAYVYDVRRVGEPVTVFDGHRKTVTYVRFLGEGRMVSAGIDGCLKQWEVVGSGEGGVGRVVRTYEGHVNERRFVGLSVWREGGLMGCGSESGEVFVYDLRWGEPIWIGAFSGGGGGDGQFVSGVCLRGGGGGGVGMEEVVGEKCTLVAGGSDGDLMIFVGDRKMSSSLGFGDC